MTVAERLYRVGSSSLSSPRLAVTYATGESSLLSFALDRRYQFDADGFADGETGLFRPVFLLRAPRVADGGAASWRVQRPLPRGDISLEVTAFARNFANRAVPSNSATRLDQASDNTVPQTNLPFDRVGGRTRGGTVSTVFRALGESSVQTSYSLSRSREAGPDGWRNAAWDVRNAIQSIWIWAFKPGWELSSAVQYRSGARITPVSERVLVPFPFSPGFVTPRLVFGDNNSARLPAFFRTDLSIRKSWGVRRHYWWSAQIINATNRTNVVGYDWDNYLNALQNGATTLVAATGGLPLVPSLSVGVRW
jgi:hypothetical protein